MICPQCSGVARLAFHTPDRNRRLSAVIFSYYRCQECGLIFLDPVPADLGTYYPDEYYPIPASLAKLAQRAAKQQFKISHVQRYVQKGRLLEIGPSFGMFAYLAHTAGFAVDALEMDERCCKFLRETVGVNVYHSSDPISTLATLGLYEVIALYQVIEHVTHPWDLLKTIGEHLSSGGVGIISTPNPEALQFKLFRGRWTHVDAPRHLQLIPMDTLILWGEKSGLKVVRVEARDEESIGLHGPYSWRMTLANFTQSQFLRRGLIRAGGAFSKLMKPVERLGRWGSTYTVTFQKD